MFSGIVAATGRILSVTPLEDGVRLAVDVGTLDLDDVQLGDSIANNGVCLTVIAREGNTVHAGLSRETPTCTLGLRAPGAADRESALRRAVSLTVNLVDGCDFSINLIPHTVQVTTLKRLAAGSTVNLEIDLIARYVERMQAWRNDATRNEGSPA